MSAEGAHQPPVLSEDLAVDAVEFLLDMLNGLKNLDTCGDNRSTIKVGAMDKLPKVIDIVIEAVSAGELDKVLKAALGERRVKLRQVS